MFKILFLFLIDCSLSNITSNTCSLQTTSECWFFFHSFFFLVAPHSMWGFIHEQGSNLCPLQWKHRALITREFPRLYFLKNFHHFIYLFIFLAVLCLCGSVWAFSSCSEWGPLFTEVHGSLIVVASHVAKHRLEGAWVLVVAAHQL